jgi:hypothetical protein
LFLEPVLFIPKQRGGVVLVIVFVSLFLMELITRRVFHDSNYYLTHRWPIPVGFVFSGFVVRLCLKPRPKAMHENDRSWYISRSGEIDAHLHQERSVLSFLRFFRNEDSYFLIPVRFWPWVLSGLEVLFYFFPLQNFE